MRDFCRRLRYDNSGSGRIYLADHPDARGYRLMGGNGCSPLPNIWLGVSVEDQATTDERVPVLLQTSAAIRFLSCEPLLGPVDLSGYLPGERESEDGCGLQWVIVGGESGPRARPMHPEWVRLLRDQCAGAGVPFFFKQWGEWAECSRFPDAPAECVVLANGVVLTPEEAAPMLDMPMDLVRLHKPTAMIRVGKQVAGAKLDGELLREMPALPAHGKSERLDDRLCPKCKKNAAAEPHKCPFHAEVYEEDVFCTCCEECANECADEV